MLKTHMVGTALVLEVSGPRLDAAQAVRFREEFLLQIEENPEQVVIDFTNVTFLDSSGLGALVSVVKRLNKHGRPVICGLQPAVQTMFSLTRMDQVMTVRKTRDDAIASFAN